MASVREPAKAYWTTGIVASLLVHAGLVGGLALVADRIAVAKTPTEITFTDDELPAAVPVEPEAETVAPTEVAAPVEQETAAATVTPETSAKDLAEALKPDEAAALKPDEATALSATPVRPTETSALAPETPEQIGSENETAVPVEPAAEREAIAAVTPEAAPATEAAALPPETVEPSKAAQLPATEVQPAAQAETTAETVPEAVQPSASAETAPESEPDVATGPTEVATVLPDAGAAKVTSVQQPTVPSPVTAETAPGAAPAETVAALTPSATSGVEPVQPQPEALQPAAPSSGSEAAPLASIGPETVQPVAPVAEAVSGGEPEVLAPTAGSPIGSAAETIAPDQPEPALPPEKPAETALLLPPRPDWSLDPPAERYNKIVDLIRKQGIGDCFIALPAMNPNGSLTLETYGRGTATQDAFEQVLDGIDGHGATVDSERIADPQCQALSFAHAMKRYPDFSMIVDIDQAALAERGVLSGSVHNAAGAELYLFLVDEAGLVQSIDTAFSVDAGVGRFSVPLSSTGGQPADTRQLLMAISTDRPFKILSVNEQAAKFLPVLQRLIAVSGANVDVAVKGFTIR